MKILTFDTCFNKTYICLSYNNNILENIVIPSNEDNYHSAYLIPELRNILVKHKILIKDLDAIGINIGPGSFTGIRAGITVARVLAQQFNTKLVGVSSMEILSKINSGNAVIALDARKNKVYFAEYKNGKEVIPPSLLDKDNLLSKINGDIPIIADKSISLYLSENSINSTSYEDNDSDFGLYLSQIVYNKLNDTNTDTNWAKVKPLYIQKPSITMPKAVKNVC